MNDFNEPNDNIGLINIENTENTENTEISSKEQDEFNKRFLVKFMIFMFFYRFCSMHIDQEGVVIGLVDDVINQSPNQSSINLDDIPIDDLD